MSGWEEFEPMKSKPGNTLISKISIRLGEIAIANNLADEHMKGAKRIIILFNKKTGQVGLKPTQVGGYGIRADSGKGACKRVWARKFLKEHPIERGHYPAEWNDINGGMIVFQAWEPKKVGPENKPQRNNKRDEEEEVPSEIRKTDPEISSGVVDFCPECEELTFKNGVCSSCGYTTEQKIYTVECPHGCKKPLENVEEKCMDCGFFKRQWGKRKAACNWEGWEEE